MIIVYGADGGDGAVGAKHGDGGVGADGADEDRHHQLEVGVLRTPKLVNDSEIDDIDDQPQCRLFESQNPAPTHRSSGRWLSSGRIFYFPCTYLANTKKEKGMRIQTLFP